MCSTPIPNPFLIAALSCGLKIQLLSAKKPSNACKVAKRFVILEICAHYEFETYCYLHKRYKPSRLITW